MFRIMKRDKLFQFRVSCLQKFRQQLFVLLIASWGIRTIRLSMELGVELPLIMFINWKFLPLYNYCVFVSISAVLTYSKETIKKWRLEVRYIYIHIYLFLQPSRFRWSLHEFLFNAILLGLLPELGLQISIFCLRFFFFFDK